MERRRPRPGEGHEPPVAGRTPRPAAPAFTWGLRAAALASLIAAPAGAAPEDSPPGEEPPATEHLRHGQWALKVRHYAEALKDFDALAAPPPPEVLVYQGIAYEHLGRTDDARRSYQAYLYAASSDSLLTGVARLGVERLRWKLPTSYEVTRLHRELRPIGGMIFAGWQMLLGGYIPGFFAGLVAGNSSPAPNYAYHSYGNSSTAGWTLLVPVLGPFVSATLYRSLDWAIAWPLTTGLAQLGGLALVIVGAVRRHWVMVPRQVQVGPLASAGTAGLSFAVPF